MTFNLSSYTIGTMLQAQLPLFKITVAKFLALMTLLLVLFYYSTTSIFFSYIFGVITNKISPSNTYFVIVNSKYMYLSIFIFGLLTSIYFFFPQLQNKTGWLVSLLVSTGMILLFLTVVVSMSLTTTLFDNPRYLNLYGIFSTLGTILAIIGIAIFVVQCCTFHFQKKAVLKKVITPQDYDL